MKLWRISSNVTLKPPVSCFCHKYRPIVLQRASILIPPAFIKGYKSLLQMAVWSIVECTLKIYWRKILLFINNDLTFTKTESSKSNLHLLRGKLNMAVLTPKRRMKVCFKIQMYKKVLGFYLVLLLTMF